MKRMRNWHDYYVNKDGEVFERISNNYNIIGDKDDEYCCNAFKTILSMAYQNRTKKEICDFTYKQLRPYINHCGDTCVNIDGKLIPIRHIVSETWFNTKSSRFNRVFLKDPIKWYDLSADNLTICKGPFESHNIQDNIINTVKCLDYLFGEYNDPRCLMVLTLWESGIKISRRTLSDILLNIKKEKQSSDCYIYEFDCISDEVILYAYYHVLMEFASDYICGPYVNSYFDMLLRYTISHGYDADGDIDHFGVYINIKRIYTSDDPETESKNTLYKIFIEMVVNFFKTELCEKIPVADYNDIRQRAYDIIPKVQFYAHRKMRENKTNYKAPIV